MNADESSSFRGDPALQSGEDVIKVSHGFVLPEILLVMFLIGFMATIGIAVYRGQILKSYDARRKSDLYRLKLAAEEYEKDYDCYPDTLPSCTSSTNDLEDYIGEIPCDPETSYDYLYETDGLSCPRWFRIYARLKNEKDASSADLGCNYGCGPGYWYTYYVSSPNAPEPQKGDASTTPTPQITMTATPSPTPTLTPTITPSPTPGPTATPTPVTPVFNPVADSFGDSGSPASNFGLQTTLEVDGSPAKIAYLKFDLTSLAGKTVNSAKFRFRVCTTLGCDSGATQNVKAVDDTSWGETTITYNNRSSLGATQATNSGGALGEWKEVDITSYVASKVGGLMSLGIDSSGGDGFDVYSRETVDKPELVVVYSN